MPRDPKGKKEEPVDPPAPPLSYGWFGNLLIDSGRLWRRHARAVVIPFLFLIGFLSLTPLAILPFQDSSARSAVVTSLYLLRIFGVPLLGAWVVARVAVLVEERERALALETGEGGVPEGGAGPGGATWRGAGARTKPQRSHIAAAAMLATALTLFLGVALDLLGFAVAPFLFLGPPLLIHAIALEGLSFVDGWARMRALMKGEAARTIVYLVSVALALALAQIIVTEGVRIGLTDVGLGIVAEVAIILIVSLVTAGVALSFMALVGIATFNELKRRNEIDAARP